ncbi:MAG: transporter substrate-binding domain-containing protein [Burkholderiaceae bacterium]|jgi:polar amino acid transport system substrate-binding protein
MLQRLFALVFFGIVAACSIPNRPDPNVVSELAPTGVLRAAINLGNPILAAREPGSNELTGVSVDLAQSLAHRLHVPLRLIAYESAGQVVLAAATDDYDVAFVARDPLRSQTLLQTSAYVAVTGSYLVRADSPIRRNAEVDATGVRVAVGAGSAYDLYLSRTLSKATLVRVPTSPEVTDAFLRQGLEVAAGVTQQLKSDASRVPGLRLLPGSFMQIDQAMAVHPGKLAAAEFLERFLSDQKRSGFISDSLRSHHIEGAEVAP